MALNANNDGGQRAGGVERVEGPFDFRGTREISLNCYVDGIETCIMEKRVLSR